jgi:Cu-processing system ATP-binding protein
VITLKNIHKRFGSHQVLRDVSLHFPSGTITAVIGPNGSGKTTMMKTILGLVTPASGDIIVNGLSAVNNASAREQIGYMAQIARYPENLSAREVIDMIRGLRQREVSGAIEILVDQFALRPHLDKPMKALSGGTRQKVGAVIAMMFDPSILLLDEPTAGLDPVTSESLKDQISRRRDAGSTVLVTSHILSEIAELADRVVYLHEGAVMYEGDVDQLLHQTGADTLTRAVASMMMAEEI